MKDVMLPWNCKPMVTGLLCNVALLYLTGTQTCQLLQCSLGKARSDMGLQLLVPVIIVLEF